MRSRSQASRSSSPTKPSEEQRPPTADKPMEGRPSITTSQGSAGPTESASASPTVTATDKLIEQTETEQERRDAAARRGAAEAPKSRDELKSSIERLSMGAHSRIVDTLFRDDYDPMVEYTAIKASITFGGRASAMSYGQLVDALDEAHEICERASRLLANAKVTLDAFNIDAEVVRGALRDRATEDLQAQKASGERTKAITNDDVISVMAKKFHDEYRALELATGKARRMVAAIEQLFDRCVARAGDLRTMVAKTRES